MSTHVVTSSSWSGRNDIPNDRPSIIQQVDLLQRIAKDAKRYVLGADWFKEVKNFYSLDASTGPGPLAFRPRVDIPQLQMFMLAETAELTDNTPVIYLTGGDANSRDKERERIFRAIWKQEWYNLSILYAQLWANFGGTGILAVGIDPFAYNGRGTVWLDPLDPDNFDPDPTAIDDNWEYTVATIPMTLDAVRRRWPDRGWSVPPKPSARTPVGDNVGGLNMPFGPMSSMGGTPATPRGGPSGLVNVRFTHTLDPTPEKVKEAAGSSAARQFMSASRFKLMFPNGRLTIDADGYLLYDGNSPSPMHRKFPYIPYYGLPKLEGFWAPPPIRYTRNLQEFAERYLTQIFENIYRCNNGIWFLPDGSGITADKFGGIPGEIQVYNGTHGEPKFIKPDSLPAGAIEVLKFVLGTQADLQGYSGARGGQPGSGNLSVELYEAAIEESSKLTKLRAKLMAKSVQRTAEQVFYHMAKYFSRTIQFPSFDEEFEMLPWNPIDSADTWNVWVDPGSIEVMSSKNLRKTALALNQAGKIDDETMLTILGFPGGKEIAEKASSERQLAALTAIRQGRTQKRQP